MGISWAKTSAAVDLSATQVARWSEDHAHDVFASIRFAATNGVPQCPKCGHVGAYLIKAHQRSRATLGKPVQRRVSETGTPSVRRLFKCKVRSCGRQYSVTAGTIWHDRKMPLRDILCAIVAFTEGRLGEAALRMRRSLGCHYTTALVAIRKMREAIAASQSRQKLTGQIFVDATVISSGDPRNPNLKSDKYTEEWAAYAKEHRERTLALVTVRQLCPVRITRTRIVAKEGPEAFDFARRQISRDAQAVNTDEGGAWNNMKYHLKDRERHKTVNHSERYADYSADGPITTNPNEAFHAMLKGSLRGVYGRGILYLQDFFDEMSWRADHRFHSTGEQFLALSSACAAHPVSVRWTGYWQGRLPVAEDHTNRLAVAGSIVPVYRRAPRKLSLARALASLRARRSADRSGSSR